MLVSATPTTTAIGEPGLAVRVSPETALLVRAATEYSSECEVVDLSAYVVDTRRGKGSRPATIEVLVPDEVVKSLTGEPERRGKLLALWVPATVLEDLTRLVVSPQEAAAGAGPLIVTP